MVYGSWVIIEVFRFSRFMIYGLWFMVYALRFLVSGSWFLVDG